MTNLYIRLTLFGWACFCCGHVPADDQSIDNKASLLVTPHVTHLDSQFPAVLAFAPGEQELYVGTSDGELLVFNIPDLKLKHRKVFVDRTVVDAKVSPDGKWCGLVLDSTISGEKPIVAIVDTDSQEHRVLPLSDLGFYSLAWHPDSKSLFVAGTAYPTKPDHMNRVTVGCSWQLSATTGDVIKSTFFECDHCTKVFCPTSEEILVCGINVDRSKPSFKNLSLALVSAWQIALQDEKKKLIYQVAPMGQRVLGIAADQERLAIAWSSRAGMRQVEVISTKDRTLSISTDSDSQGLQWPIGKVALADKFIVTLGYDQDYKYQDWNEQKCRGEVCLWSVQDKTLIDVVHFNSSTELLAVQNNNIAFAYRVGAPGHGEWYLAWMVFSVE